MTKTERKRQIEELDRILQTAHRNYEIYKELRLSGNTPEYAAILNEHARYFLTTTEANLVTATMALYSFYDERQGTCNIYTLLERPETAQSVKSQLDKVKPIIKKIRILRSTVFGHRSSKISRDTAFQKANISPQEIRELIDVSHSILNTISQTEHRHTYLLDDDVKDCAIKLLNSFKTAR